MDKTAGVKLGNYELILVNNDRDTKLINDSKIMSLFHVINFGLKHINKETTYNPGLVKKDIKEIADFMDWKLD